MNLHIFYDIQNDEGDGLAKNADQKEHSSK